MIKGFSSGGKCFYLMHIYVDIFSLPISLLFLFHKLSILRIWTLAFLTWWRERSSKWMSMIVVSKYLDFRVWELNFGSFLGSYLLATWAKPFDFLDNSKLPFINWWDWKDTKGKYKYTLKYIWKCKVKV